MTVEGTTSVDSFTLRVALTAQPDTTVAVVGPNGSGKTTLLHTVAGLITLQSGTVMLGDSVWDDPTGDRLLDPEQRPIALVPQNALLFPHLTVLDNVAFGLRHRRTDLSRHDRRTRAFDALAAADLSELAHRKPQQLSGGQRQRTAIVRALVTEPAVLLLDEPLANVDAANRHSLRKAIEAHRPPGQIQLVVTHGRDHATTADQVVALDRGSVTAAGPPAEVAATTKLAWLKEMLEPGTD